MTVTLTVEEIRTHEANLSEWYASRFIALVKALAFRFGPLDQSYCRDEMTRFDEAHPKPKLLPNL